MKRSNVPDLTRSDPKDYFYIFHEVSSIQKELNGIVASQLSKLHH